MELKISNLTKCYKDTKALDNFSFTFTDGVYGLLGPNGAGKSTLMNIITDNLAKTSGSITFDGKDIQDNSKNFRSVLGFMPQQQGVYPGFSLNRFLYYFAALKGISKADADKQIPKIIRTVNLDDSRKKRLGAFSGGMKQRALIAQALLGDPKVIILDEPTAGLDPKERIRIRNLISRISMNRIVIIATHVVSDIEFIAKEIVLLKKGVVINSNAPHNLCKELDGNVIDIKCTKDNFNDVCKEYCVSNISKDDKYIYIRAICDNKPTLYEYEVVKPTLEDVYLYYFGEETEYENIY